MRDWAGGTVLQKLLGLTRLALKPESASGFRAILVIGGLALPAGKAWTTPCFPRSRASPLPLNMGSTKSGLSSAKIWVTKTVSSASSVVTVIRDRKGGGIASNWHGPDGDRVERIASEEDGNGALGMVRHIEQIAVRRQRAAPRLGARGDVAHDPAPHEVNDRDGGADAVGDIRHLVVRVDCHAARLFANADLGKLDGDIVALRVFHSE